MEQNIYIMEFWKLKKNRKRIVFCIIFCSIITFLIFTLACKIIGADVMEACVPVHIMRMIMNNFYPEIIIDGEISYSILMYDSFIFYGTIIFLITSPAFSLFSCTIGISVFTAALVILSPISNIIIGILKLLLLLHLLKFVADMQNHTDVALYISQINLKK